MTEEVIGNAVDVVAEKAEIEKRRSGRTLCIIPVVVKSAVLVD